MDGLLIVANHACVDQLSLRRLGLLERVYVDKYKKTFFIAGGV
ncbi:hypothetical protein [Candidatus Nitronereus thalassa]|uniref:Uncharacterized protein n=1 Tax=Candidatus Nitronereus thalassa TaxID=3020898 RepID=A0ABU3KAV3_9BACT|nr:hypothetical protein [Candidatus Nitronereus thalassa]MDT7043534.1 hypothetical protein [Candidatus Nitronereus thalassa]